MPEQLIFTSAPTGILPGRSGFQVVAQHKTIHHRLVLALEQESTYEFKHRSSDLPVVSKLLKFDFEDEHFSVLTRIQSCGVDFTGRPNHIAHHLIFNDKTLPACPPAALFVLWKGWRSNWKTRPRYLGAWDRVNYENDAYPFSYPNFAFPARNWKKLTQDAGCAALPVLMGQKRVIFPLANEESDLLELFFESQSLIDINAAWQIPFTTCLLETDRPEHYQWIGIHESSLHLIEDTDGVVLDVFRFGMDFEAPEHEMAEMARRASTISSTVEGEEVQEADATVEQVEDGTDYIQDELGLESDFAESEAEESVEQRVEDPGSAESGGTLESRVDDEDVEETSVEIPDLNFNEEDVPLQELSSRRPFWHWAVGTLVLAGIAAVGVWLAPEMIETLNRSMDPHAPIVRVIEEDPDHQLRVETIQMDPETRLAHQLGEVDAIMESGRFLHARAYLAQFRSNPEFANSEKYRRLEEWYDEQRGILEQVHSQIETLEQQVGMGKVIPDFESLSSEIKDNVGQLASGLRTTLESSVDSLMRDYLEWLSQVRLRTENVPTFFIPISVNDRNPRVRFSDLPQRVVDWFAALEGVPGTTQVEGVQTQIAEFHGLNAFEMGSTRSLNLSLWKHNQRSLIAYLDGQTEVMEILVDQKIPDQVTVVWRFGEEGFAGRTRSEGRFPDPPLILSLTQTESNQSLYIIVTGGISDSVLVPAEVPLSFLDYNADQQRFEINDPILREKLDWFLMPASKYLRLRSHDGGFHFAMDSDAAGFYLYESSQLETPEVQEIQYEISLAHQQLTDYQRTRTVFESVDFIEHSPLWSIGSELIPPTRRPPELANFGLFFEQRPARYFEYLRTLMVHFGESFTMVRPSVMENWLAYPKNAVPSSREDILVYRDMLLRISKRLRSLLREDDPMALEHWRHFVTNLEFWLLGEHEERLIDILGLSESEIQQARDTDIEWVSASIEQLQATISRLQGELSDNTKLEDIEHVKHWVLEMTTLTPQRMGGMPLIVFK